MGKFRNECLSLEWFRNRTEAWIGIEHWRRHDNEERPHMSLGDLTPAELSSAVPLCPAHDVSRARGGQGSPRAARPGPASGVYRPRARGDAPESCWCCVAKPVSRRSRFAAVISSGPNRSVHSSSPSLSLGSCQPIAETWTLSSIVAFRCSRFIVAITSSRSCVSPANPSTAIFSPLTITNGVRSYSLGRFRCSNPPRSITRLARSSSCPRCMTMT